MGQSRRVMPDGGGSEAFGLPRRALLDAFRVATCFDVFGEFVRELARADRVRHDVHRVRDTHEFDVFWSRRVHEHVARPRIAVFRFADGADVHEPHAAGALRVRAMRMAKADHISTGGLCQPLDARDPAILE